MKIKRFDICHTCKRPAWHHTFGVFDISFYDIIRQDSESTLEEMLLPENRSFWGEDHDFTLSNLAYLERKYEEQNTKSNI